MMKPNPTVTSSFDYPEDRLLPVRGIVSERELTHPQMRDVDDQSYVLLIKNGLGSNTTIGRSNGIRSYTRGNFPNGEKETSLELPILGLNGSAFSEDGESGVLIVDGQGCAAALLAGGSGGDIKSVDITYGTPFEWLWETIKTQFPAAEFHPFVPE